MGNNSFEKNHLSEDDIIRYIGLSDLKGEKGEFAKAVQKHLCNCRECCANLILVEKLFDKARAVSSYKNNASFDLSLETARLNEKAAALNFSKLASGEKENTFKILEK